MNILTISPYFSPAVGGVETHLNDLCKFLESRKHTIFVRTYKALGVTTRGKTNEIDEFIKIHRLWWPNFNLIFKLEKYPTLKFLYIFLGIFFDCLTFLSENYKKIDVIQAHGFIAGLVGVILGKLFNKRVVINTHVGFKLNEGFMTQIIKWTLNSADKVLVLTDGIKRSLVSLGIPESKLDIYHYWVDQKTFAPVKNAKARLNWGDKFIVLFVGRLIEVKGVLKIFDLAEKLKNVTFAIAGSGPLSEEIEKKSKDYKNVIFLGKMDNKNLPLYYSASDILLIPSRVVKQEYQEGIPRVMIEALSCGLPVITTPAGGIPDIFSPNIGMMVNDNTKQLNNALEKLYINQDILKRAARNSRLFAKDVFGIKNAEIIEKSLYDTYQPKAPA